MTEETYEPFRGSWAIAAGLYTRRQLESRCRRIYRDVWIDRRATTGFRELTLATGYWLNGDGVLSGFSASELHKAKWIEDDARPEAMSRSRWRCPPEIDVIRCNPPDADVMEVEGFKVTTPARTAFDLARRLEFEKAVTAVDALANATHLTDDDLMAVYESHPHYPGRDRVPLVARAMDMGAESPTETVTRLTIVGHGLPRPETQIVVRDGSGGLAGHGDMGYRRVRVIVEYEGAHHGEDEQLEIDVERYYKFEQLGWHTIRVTKRMLREPWILVERVESALRAGGWRPGEIMAPPRPSTRHQKRA